MFYMRHDNEASDLALQRRLAMRIAAIVHVESFIQNKTCMFEALLYYGLLIIHVV